MGIEYRSLDLHSAIEIQQHRDLYKISFGKPISDSEWKWKYIQNPSGKEKLSPIYVAISENAIVGSLTLLPMQLDLHTVKGKKNVHAGLVTSAIVHPNFRKKGIFSRLLSLVLENAAREGLEFLYVYAVNEYSAHTFSKYGFKEVRGFNSYGLYLNPRQTMGSFLNTNPFSVPLKFTLNFIPTKPFHIRSYWKDNYNFQFSCGKADDLFSDIEHLHRNSPANNSISGVRNLQSLRWFFGYPGKKYFYFSMRAGEELMAYCIIRQQDYAANSLQKIAIIEDSFDQRGKTTFDRRFLLYLIEQLRNHHFTKISTCFFRQDRFTRFPFYNGFICRPDNTRFFYYLVREGNLSYDLLNTINWDVQQAERTPF
jgi:ribosomal protein S18 acetylase RimI-like enzyme